MLKAYVDESAHVGSGLCVVGVAVMDQATEAEAIAVLRAVLPPGARRLHWNKDSTVVRSQVIKVLASRAHHCRAYLSYFDAAKRSEDARERCLVHLFADLGGRPYDEIILDQRTNHQDTRDLVVWSNQCVRLSLPHPPTVRHDGTLTEPLLWLADAVAGAVGEHLVKGNESFIRDMAHKLTIV